MSPETPLHIPIRESRDDERDAIRALLTRAFPEEDLTGLVASLLGRDDVLSLVASDGDGPPIGHMILTTCPDAAGARTVALLGPLCVDPARQRGGIGSGLIRNGIARMAEDGIGRVCVLGDPGYYSRFGFEEEPSIETPCPIPAEWTAAWRSLRTGADSSAPEAAAGPLQVPAPWDDPALWSA